MNNQSQAFPPQAVSPFDTLNQAERLVAKLPIQVLETLVLIGGQALLIWAEKYLIDKLSGEQYASVASDDLDLLGSQYSIKQCALYWNGQPKIAEIDDQTPNTGTVVINENGELKSIEFLEDVFGIKKREVYAYADVLNFGSTGNPKPLKVLSPPLCLKSRIANIAGLHYSPEKKARESIRIQVAIAATYHYLNELVQVNEVKALNRAINYILKKIINTSTGRMVAANYSIDFSEVFPKSIRSVSPSTYDSHIRLQMSKHTCRVEAILKAKALKTNQSKTPRIN